MLPRTPREARQSGGATSTSKLMEVLRAIRAGRNLFVDLGFDFGEAEHLKIRADLMIQGQQLIAAAGRKQADIAKTLEKMQPRVSDLLRGRIHLFSTDTLIDMLARLGGGVRLVLIQSLNARRVA